MIWLILPAMAAITVNQVSLDLLPGPGVELAPAVEGRDARGYSSTSAAQTVKQPLDSLPAGCPDRLRRIILSSADDLFRGSGLAR